MPRPRLPRDPVVLAALALCFGLCLHGIGATILHPDQMALRPLFLPDHGPFNPGWFEKPPGYPYLDWALAVAPVDAIGRAVGAAPAATRDATIVWSRVVAATMLLASVLIAYDVARRAFGAAAGRAVAVVLALGAGMIAFVHQLTADVPVTLAMLVALRLAVAIHARGRVADYVGAGLATGIATAIKYNGLGVGIAIVVAHAFRVLAETDAGARPAGARGAGAPWRRLVCDRRVWLGLGAVPLGFLLLNPYALFDFRTFWADFRYNALVAPVYEGQSGRSYAAFFVRMTEVVGVPTTLATLVGAAAALALVARRRRIDAAAATFWTTLAVVAVYYATFARFPRLETRFVLPIVPFVLLLAAPAWARLRAASGTTFAIVLSALALYDAVCGAWVGRRFVDDPRFAAATWLASHVAAGSRVEVDEYSPGDTVGAATGFATTAMPFVTGRERLFRRVFAGDPFVNGSAERQQELEQPIAWYAPGALAARAPDYVVVSSLYYDRFLQPGPRRELYPSMVVFFEALLGERSGYRIAFDARSPSVPAWVYPRDIDFLDNRATVLQRADVGGRAPK
jgi:hypothetical protein